MKNIFLLPTDKPTRLHFDDKLFLSPNYQYSKIINSIVEGRNICITSDAEIKEGDWVTDCEFDIMNIIFDEDGDLTGWKKIILTTDQDLIADGVQAINDTFLEWFVNNPSCEEVNIKRISTNCSCANQSEYRETANVIVENSTCYLRNNCETKYEIIIPKEEPKLCGGHLNFLGKVTPATEAYECIICRQEYRHTNTMGGNVFPLSKCTNGISQKEYSKIREGFKKSIDGQNHFIQHFKNGGTVKDFKPLEKVKQETLEDFIKSYVNRIDRSEEGLVEKCLIDGAKWQSEQDKDKFKKEELLAFGEFCISIIADFLNGEGDGKTYSMNQLFKQFKKK